MEAIRRQGSALGTDARVDPIFGVPPSLLRDLDLKLGPKFLAMVLWIRAGRRAGRVITSAAALASDMGVVERRVRDWLPELCECGLVQLLDRGRGGSLTLYIDDPGEVSRGRVVRADPQQPLFEEPSDQDQPEAAAESVPNPPAESVPLPPADLVHAADLVRNPPRVSPCLHGEPGGVSSRAFSFSSSCLPKEEEEEEKWDRVVALAAEARRALVTARRAGPDARIEPTRSEMEGIVKLAAHQVHVGTGYDLVETCASMGARFKKEKGSLLAYLLAGYAAGAPKDRRAEALRELSNVKVPQDKVTAAIERSKQPSNPRPEPAQPPKPLSQATPAERQECREIIAAAKGALRRPETRN